ncbi:leucine-rich repeat-containing protein [Tanacetum coccineum]|uniref:Leucine-rich repeat-containing protein n=1 Tax=Tanacetum coccineum TaxID=301880 RepID=A0ABQ5AHD6_9ASTR
MIPLAFSQNINQCLPSLKELELTATHRLLRTPDFGGMSCLQKLKIEYCSCLEEIHPSLGSHESIVSIYIKGCDKLRKFPTVIWMKKLKILEFSSCEELREFPEIQSNMDSLVNLCLYKVGIEVLPSSVGEYCTNLVVIKLVASNLKRIEGNFRALKHLREFEFTGSTHLEKLPKDLFDENCCLNELSLPEMRQKIPP